MKRWIGILTIFALALVILTACSNAPQTSAPAETNGTLAALPDIPKNSDGYVDISAEQLVSVLEQNKNFALVNVHIPYGGELPKTDLFIPFDQIAAHLESLPDKNAPIVIYCRSGSMSTQAAAELAAAGYTQVYELDGGFNAWQAAGYTLLSQ
ncbi:MAG: rhodanese-like domain-containing protein [Chloroflexi bacterium]|nr:rhodanese-like domain-containing protein [Chloroflexota bacterium]